MKNAAVLLSIFSVCITLFAATRGEGLYSSNDVLRRSTFRRMLKTDRAAAIEAGLKHADPVLRSRALLELFRDGKDKALPQLKRLAADPDFRVRMTVLGCLGELPDSPERREAAKILRQNSREVAISSVAGRIAVPFKFRRTKPRLSERDDWDHAVTVVSSTELPTSGWKFATDADGIGHERDYFAVGFDDGKWAVLGVGNWEEQGFKNYDGFAWYRIVFEAPPKGDCNAVELNFGGVDEEAWVWLNGVYVGQHAVGQRGWNETFQLDVTEEIRWGERNVLVVRVFDSKLGGGIWKPVKLDILR
ncbi:MAG: HEAT repeat domain-containing protein [Lentisphaeria bacterium]|nr:HEAT repeat domain-containing protein [Lentisphaeria bacterium]